MKLLAIGLLVFTPLVSLGQFAEVESRAIDCTNCTGTTHNAYNNLPGCVSVTWDPAQSIGHGSCNQISCIETGKCTLGGSVTIANVGPTSCGDVYVRTRIDGSCGPKVTLSPGQEGDTQDFAEVTLACGTYYQVVIYSNETQADNCTAGGAAGFGWTCAKCEPVH